MDEEMLMQETQPEVEADTSEAETADTDADTPEQGAEDATETQETGEEATAPADTGTDEATTEADAEAEETAPPVVRVKFNKQERTYTTEEAAPLVEMGLKYESFKPDYIRLQDLAAANGMTVSELIDQSVKSADETLRKQILEECDGNEKWAQREFEARKAERDSKVQAARDEEAQRSQREQEEEQAALSRRLADEFLELQKETGKFTEFKDVPEKVVADAINSKRSLFDSYLRYERTEAKKTEAVKTKQVEAAKSSTGSLSDKPSIQNAPEIDAAVRGIWGK